MRSLFIVLCFLSGVSFAQYSPEKLDKLWAEKKYKACYSQAQKDAEAETKQAIPYLYQAMSLFHLQNDKKIKKEIPNVIFKITELTSKMKAQNPEGNQLAGYDTFLHQLQDSLFAQGASRYQVFGKYEILRDKSFLDASEKKDLTKALALLKEAERIFNTMHQVFDNKKEIWKNWYGQENDLTIKEYQFPEYNNPIYRFCNTAKNEHYLSQTEKEIFYVTNLARVNPKLFQKTFLKVAIPNLFSKEKKATEYELSLSNTLLEMSPSRRLLPDSSLFKSAEFHAIDLGTTGTFSGPSSDGTSTMDRIARFSNHVSVTENYWSYYHTSVDIVIAMLVDEGVSCLKQRNNLLEHTRFAGVALRPHKKYSYITVIDFAYQH